MINKDSVAELHRIYQKREELQVCREIAQDRNFWVGVANDFFGGSGRRAAVAGAIGGAGDLAEILMRATVERFEEMQQELDAEIVKLGATP